VEVRLYFIFIYLKKQALESLMIVLALSVGIAVLTTVLVSYLGLNQQLHEYLQNDHYRLFSVTSRGIQNELSLRSAPPISPDAAGEDPSLDLNLTDLEEIQNSLPRGMFAFHTQSARFNLHLPRELALTVTGTSTGFYEFYRFPLLVGEWFVDEDLEKGTPVLIVSAELANDLFGVENALGQTISFENRGISHAYTVIGVLEAGAGEYHTVYVPLGSPLFPGTHLHSFFVGINGERNLVQALEEIQGLVHLHLGDGAYVQNNLTQLQEELAMMRPILRNIGLFASMGLVIAVINILNLMLARILRRVKQAGISMALGSSRLEVFLQFLGEALILGLISALFGMAISYMAELWLQNTWSIAVYQVSVALRFLVSVGIGGIASLLFGFYPASQIMQMDLVQALRTDVGGS
jgi:putative ABC transport system permease protein